MAEKTKTGRTCYIKYLSGLDSNTEVNIVTIERTSNGTPLLYLHTSCGIREVPLANIAYFMLITVKGDK